MEYEISEVIDPIGKRHKPNSAFSVAVVNLPLNKAVIIKGMSQSSVVTRAGALGKMQSPRRKFSTQTLPNGAGVQLTRVL